MPTIVVKWAGKEFPIGDLEESSTLADLKKILENKTGVRCERQKILGLKCKGNWMLVATVVVVIVSQWLRMCYKMSLFIHVPITSRAEPRLIMLEVFQM